MGPLIPSSGEERGGGFRGEDARPTSKKELWGFYMYGWASEVFVVCGMGSFIPITLEQLARERGFLQSDRSIPCTAGLEIPAVNGTSPHPDRPNDAPQCIVNLLGLDINTASFAMYTFSLSVLFQALVIISMSGAADHGHYRKTFLLVFAGIGSIATMLYLPTTPSVLLLGSILAIVANTSYGATAVLLNSFLPLLVRYHPSLTPADDRDSGSDDQFDGHSPDTQLSSDEDITNLDTSTAALLANSSNEREDQFHHDLVEAQHLSAHISAMGVSIGYLAAFLVQVLAIIIVKSLGSSLLSLRLVCFVIGAWWLVFTLPVASWMRPRPGPPLAGIERQKSRAGIVWTYIAYSWRSLFKTIMRARRLRDVIQFLIAWFLLSDGIATISGTAILFAKTSLSMKPAALAVINIVVTICGIIGALAWRRLSLMMSLSPVHTIALCVLILEIVPLYGLLGYIPAVQRWGVLGLQQPWEMYPLAAVYGFVLGGLSSFCRSLFGALIPPGYEAAFYALYAITDKGSSIFGPAVVGAIIDGTGEIRPVSST